MPCLLRRLGLSQAAAEDGHQSTQLSQERLYKRLEGVKKTTELKDDTRPIVRTEADGEWLRGGQARRATVATRRASELD